MPSKNQTTLSNSSNRSNKCFLLSVCQNNEHSIWEKENQFSHQTTINAWMNEWKKSVSHFCHSALTRKQCVINGQIFSMMFQCAYIVHSFIHNIIIIIIIKKIQYLSCFCLILWLINFHLNSKCMNNAIQWRQLFYPIKMPYLISWKTRFLLPFLPPKSIQWWGMNNSNFQFPLFSHLALTESTSSVKLFATYGPFMTRKTINPFSVRRNDSSSFKTGKSSNGDRKKNISEQINAYLVTREVRRSHPVLRVLFYASHINHNNVLSTSTNRNEQSICAVVIGEWFSMWSQTLTYDSLSTP